ncbi:MAG TPA: hypothetical protein VJL59_01860, partial [Anaerolineales bacterium]|nr:hypothetical protein [Anaerolineales bacterium]
WVEKGEVTVDPVNNPTEAWNTTTSDGTQWPYTMSWQVTLDPREPNRLFYVNFWDIIRSDDGGEHWATKIAGAQNTCVTDLAVDGDILYATHWDAGLLASNDQGGSWTPILPSTYNDPALAGHFWRVVVAGAGEANYYFATSDPWNTDYGQVLRSEDGVNWTSAFQNTRPAGTWLGGMMLGLAVDPSQPSTLYVTQDGGDVFKSTDNGDSWSATNGQPGGNSFTYALAVDEAGRVFAGTISDGLWRSVDGGDSWGQVVNEQSTIFHALAVPGAVYASAGDGNLYRSTDGGDSWQRLTDFASEDDGDGVGQQGMAIAVGPNDLDHIFFSRLDTWHSADAGSGVVESTDGGWAWSPLNDGLGLLKVSVMAMSADGTLFAGTSCGGVWRLRMRP